MKIQVRKQTFADVVENVPLTDLPVVFEGPADKACEFMNSQAGYIRREAPKFMFGAYWYNQEESAVLFPT